MNDHKRERRVRGKEEALLTGVGWQRAESAAALGPADPKTRASVSLGSPVSERRKRRDSSQPLLLRQLRRDSHHPSMSLCKTGTPRVWNWLTEAEDSWDSVWWIASLWAHLSDPNISAYDPKVTSGGQQ
jgi:hypothetical protein